ncbi:DUF1212 domain membrane protein [Aspergillus sclerotioniger CBS 115572]|uniref:DUF1212 domain membrane protein n=1 Tax=Aspergillus sclerotioniger CBS 115572 TaxID=1450535 RepID=A0A317W9J7_9EURO|nr:DUF1212 domain membrane protein [Aspergillus sclerotioniger CBS 115572]PWY81668.1 DUF1212 domain membrane protein [Aspergillus sclerotioniger CBS 115572]
MAPLGCVLAARTLPMSESPRDDPSYELLGRQNSWEGNDDTLVPRENGEPSAPPHHEEHHDGPSEAPAPATAPTEDASNETARPARVRFRSISNHNEGVPQRPSMMPRADSDFSVRTFHSVVPTDQSADLADYFERETGPEDGEEENTNKRSSPAVEETRDSSLEKDTPEQPMSARDRWKNASKLIRQKTVLLGERLGRPLDDVGDLGAAMLPDDLEGGYPPRRRPEETEAFDPHARDGEEPPPPPSAEAHRLVRSMTQHNMHQRRKPRSAYAKSGQETPDGLGRPDSWYGAGTPGNRGGGGILSQLLKLHASQANRDNMSVTTDSSDNESVVSSGTATPRRDFHSGTFSSGTATPKKEKLKWYKKSSHQSTASLVEASMNLSRASLPASADTLVNIAPKKGKKKRKTRLEDEIRVTVHIAEILARQRYIMQLCRALMRYGAPTHRLEEYMQMTARVLEVEGQFLYLPGCMIMSFDDSTTRTAEVKLVRVVQGVDLGRLAETHNVYKNVVHDMIGVEEAIQELDFIMKRPPRFNKWILVATYGLASVAVGPFAFDARPIDMPIIFFLGCLVGFMQHVLAPRSVLYSNVFEVTAAILTSFLARAFGSINANVDGGEERLFCFSALAQSSIALILPGFMVLCSSLELQSHQMIAGSIRMVYSIIYSLFLGYGITVGTTIYGLIDGNAATSTTCSNEGVWYSKYIQHFIFVPIYVVFLAIINQGKWKQVPVMIVIAVCGYVTNYFSTLKLGSNSEVANTVGAFTIGLLGNLYSRLWHGHAATAILPGIFVLVPSGLASSGSLLAGIQYAEEVRNNLKSGNTTSTDSTSSTSIASLGFGMIQVAIGITVGLFISALIVYPYGKRRSGLFSF